MKNQKGVSLITLIITIIVVIILAVIVLRSGASDAPDQANFSKFAQEMGELQDTVNLAMLTAKGEEQLKGDQRTEAQLYNFVARGGYEGFEAERQSFDARNTDPVTFTDDEKWLTQYDAEERITATQIVNKEILEKVYNKELDVENFGIELPKRKVETAFGVGQEVLYFVTPKGNVFCWPPYVYDGKSYVNANTTVKSDTTFDENWKIVPGSIEMGETSATAIDKKVYYNLSTDTYREYDVIIVFENGEHVLIANVFARGGYVTHEGYATQHLEVGGLESNVKSMLILEYGPNDVRNSNEKIKCVPNTFRLYSNKTEYFYSYDGSRDSHPPLLP